MKFLDVKAGLVFADISSYYFKNTLFYLFEDGWLYCGWFYCCFVSKMPLLLGILYYVDLFFVGSYVLHLLQ